MKSVYRSRENGQGLSFGGSALQHSTEGRLLGARALWLARSICAAAAVLLAAGLSTIPAFGQTSIPFSFTYDYGKDTGQASIPSITFSGFTLNNVSNFGTYPPAFGDNPIVGPWDSTAFADDRYVAFKVFAPSGFEVSVDPRSLSASGIQAVAVFRVPDAGPSPSVEIQESYGVRFPGDLEALSEVSGRGELTVVPEPSTVLGGIAAAGLVGVFFVRRLTRGRSVAACA